MAAMSLCKPCPSVCAGKAFKPAQRPVASLARGAALLQRAGNRARHGSRGSLLCRAEAGVQIREYPDPGFIAETLEAFPDKAIANAEEARALFSNGGYVYLDVRPPLELEATGKVKGSVNIPIVNAKYVYNAEAKKKEVIKEDNPDFVAQVQKRFPNLETQLLIACSDGRAYSIDALEALDEAGYVNLVGLKGGFYAWYRLWDNNLRRRRSGEYAESYLHDGDSCGIHSSGAGFDKVDKIEAWVPPKF